MKVGSELAEELVSKVHLTPAKAAAVVDVILSARTRTVTGTNIDRVRGRLTRVMTPALDVLDPVPHATVEQARRLASLRTRLLESGAVRYEDLADVRGATNAAVRQAVSRAVRRHEMFTVPHDGKTLIPVFQLDEAFRPRPELRAVLTPLRTAGEQGWAIWTWFETPSAWLGGERPVDLLDGRAEDVAEAARRRASNAA